MTIKASGQSLSFSEISAEFGLPSGRNLGAYRVSQNVGTLTDLPLDTGIPQSGEIKFSDFYSKKLNMIVDLYSIPDNSVRLTARTRYNNGSLTVIGGFTSKPASSSGKRVIINVNKIIGSAKGDQRYVALRTGGWESGTQLEMEIGSSATITGAGGNGGLGATSEDDNKSPFMGQAGSSALGIEYPTTIRNRGYIQSGRGGGGGGALAISQGNCRRTQRSCQGCQVNKVYGGGGAGGRGLPSGDGGFSYASLVFNVFNSPFGNVYSGTSGSLTSDGNAGQGYTLRAGECNKCTQYGSSGSGGTANSNGGGASGCSRTYSNQGDGGAEGFAIIYSPEDGGADVGSSVTNSDAGSVSGSTTVSVFY
jgi:hypothetical protein